MLWRTIHGGISKLARSILPDVDCAGPCLKGGSNCRNPHSAFRAILPSSPRPSRRRPRRECFRGWFLGNGDAPKKVIVRTIGPSLAAAGITRALADPRLQLIDSTGKILAANEDWTTSGHAREIVATKLPPNDQKFAFVATLAPGVCTAIETGVGAGCYLSVSRAREPSRMA
jgi:hypothetical protein